MSKRRLLLVIPNVRRAAAVGVAAQAFVAVDMLGSGIEALEAVVAVPLDVAVVDATIGDMRCEHLVRALRARQPRCSLVVLAPGREADGIREISRCRLDGFFLSDRSLQPLVQGLFDLLEIPRVLSRPVAAVIDFASLQPVPIPSLETLAADARTSPKQLLRRFRQDLDMSVKDYLLRIQIAVSQRLLRMTDDKLEEVAHQAGFSDSSHLSRMFLQHTGLRPGCYRNGRSRGLVGRGQVFLEERRKSPSLAPKPSL